MPQKYKFQKYEDQLSLCGYGTIAIPYIQKDYSDCGCVHHTFHDAHPSQTLRNIVVTLKCHSERSLRTDHNKYMTLMLNTLCCTACDIATS